MLKEYRETHNMTQQQMAKLLDVSNSSYSLYENNKREMTIETMIKFLRLRNDLYDEKVIEILKDFKKHV